MAVKTRFKTQQEDETLLAALKQAEAVQQAAKHPVNLLRHMRCFDERQGVEFGFNMDDPQGPWGWQREALELAYEHDRVIFLKARQIGVTWIFCGFGVWLALNKPGVRCLFYRQRHEDAIDLVRRAWYQLQSLPEDFWNGAKITTPSRGGLPTDKIELAFPDGKLSTIMGMTSASSSGHGYTGSFVLLDEFARIDNADEIMKAVSAVAGTEGWIVIVSTANGVSNETTGQGNQFHYLWVNTATNKLKSMFLDVFKHPDRDQRWYETSPEVLMLKPHERAEQYPRDEYEAFTFSMAHYFDAEAMGYYSDCISEPLYRMDFRRMTPRSARKVRSDNGAITVFAEPHRLGRYAMGCDVAQGEQFDFSAATVIDLDTMEIAAVYHGKDPSDVLAEQWHYLGKLYNDAWMAIENQGGWGTPIIDALRMGYDGRPYYPALYRHRRALKIDRRQEGSYGMPMTVRDRPKVLEQMAAAIRERALPALPRELLHEMKTFIRFNWNKIEARGPWPRAQDGCNDDRVLSTAIALELYQQRGEHPLRPQRRAISDYAPRFLGGHV